MPLVHLAQLTLQQEADDAVRHHLDDPLYPLRHAAPS